MAGMWKADSHAIQVPILDMTIPVLDQRLILVVEDEELISALIEDILQEANFEVALARDAGQAMVLADTLRRIDAVMIDIHLGDGQDGRSVLRQLRTGRPQLPAVVLTGYDPSSSNANLRGLGGPTTRLEKPFNARDLVASVDDVLASTNGRASRDVYQRRTMEPDTPG